ncbi:MAG: winged helix-turn-helix transcriptional regulator [Gammaproteobacteria bacterium]|nr:winged helix-turn-helix transcriptional regulator [Gammaproteobacteria bacterium]
MFHHRWSVPIMAELHGSGIGTRFVVLVNALGIHRAMLSTTLSALMAANLVMRSPGYGHPLRPEYVLTAAGKRVALHCARFETLVDEQGISELAHRKWTAPLLLAMRAGRTRFNAIQAALVGISPRALTTALRALTTAGLTSRQVDDGYPPRTTYKLCSTGRRIANAVARIAERL